MDLFSVCLNAVCLTGQGAAHIFFSGRLTGKRRRGWHYALYIVLLCLLEWLTRVCSFPWLLVIGAETLILYGVNRFALGNRSSASWITAIFAAYITQFSFGAVNSVEALLFPHLIGRPLLYVLVAAAVAVSFVLCMLCFAAVLRLISLEEDAASAGCLLFPVLFSFASEAYIMQISYLQPVCGDPASALALEDVGRHTALLLLQVLGLGSLLCTLYAYRHLCRSLQAQAEARSLAQAAQAQKVYVAEAKTRDERTRAFRHDIKNHLSVLSGLLRDGKLEEGRSYLRRLEAVSAALSFPYRTGNPVVDILLGEKLGVAEASGIAAEVSLVLPGTCAVEDFDLCVIFANALDNAISACQALEGERSIRVSGQRQGDFYRLSFENSCPDGPLPPAGTGLSNIRSAAEKYHGAILTEKERQRFSLDVLLNISLPSGVISAQSPCNSGPVG